VEEKGRERKLERGGSEERKPERREDVLLRRVWREI